MDDIGGVAAVSAPIGSASSILAWKVSYIARMFGCADADEQPGSAAIVLTR